MFGAVWGAAECTLGALLRVMAVPLHGSVMTAIGVTIMLVARRVLSPSRGTSLAIGLVALAILPLSISRGFLMAMLGILLEAGGLEAALWFGRPRPWRFGLAAFFVGLIPPLQRVARMVVYYGPAALTTFRETLLTDQGAARLGLAGLTAGALLAVALLLSASFCCMCGLFAWSVSGQILKRLGRAAA